MGKGWSRPLLLSSVPLLLSSSALACDCGNELSVGPSFREASSVFVGKVIAIEPGYLQRRAVTLQVVRRWKGAPFDTITLGTGLGDGDCGVNFGRGEEWMVYSVGFD